MYCHLELAPAALAGFAVKTRDHYRHGAHARLARSPDSLGDPSEPKRVVSKVLVPSGSGAANSNLEGTNYMKQKQVLVVMIGATALLALMAGCATTQTSTQDQRNMLVAAGFKTISPKTPAQQQKLQQLQTGQVAQIQKNGRTCYIVADPPQNVVYVGGPTEYQAYQQMRAQRQLAQENLQTAEMYQDAAMQWGAWGGWGVGWGRMGYGVGVGRVGGVGRF